MALMHLFCEITEKSSQNVSPLVLMVACGWNRLVLFSQLSIIFSSASLSCCSMGFCMIIYVIVIYVIYGLWAMGMCEFNFFH